MDEPSSALPAAGTQAPAEQHWVPQPQLQFLLQQHDAPPCQEYWCAVVREQAAQLQALQQVVREQAAWLRNQAARLQDQEARLQSVEAQVKDLERQVWQEAVPGLGDPGEEREREPPAQPVTAAAQPVAITAQPGVAPAQPAAGAEPMAAADVQPAAAAAMPAKPVQRSQLNLGAVSRLSEDAVWPEEDRLPRPTGATVCPMCTESGKAPNTYRWSRYTVFPNQFVCRACETELHKRWSQQAPPKRPGRPRKRPSPRKRQRQQQPEAAQEQVLVQQPVQPPQQQPQPQHAQEEPAQRQQNQAQQQHAHEAASELLEQEEAPPPPREQQQQQQQHVAAGGPTQRAMELQYQAWLAEQIRLLTAQMLERM